MNSDEFQPRFVNVYEPDPHYKKYGVTCLVTRRAFRSYRAPPVQSFEGGQDDRKLHEFLEICEARNKDPDKILTHQTRVKVWYETKRVQYQGREFDVNYLEGIAFDVDAAIRLATARLL